MIRNLLFDLGGVIMDIKRENCVKALQEIGFADAGDYLGDYGQKGPFGQLEEGLISPAEFRDFVRGRVDAPLTDMQIDVALNKFLIGIPVERLHRLQQLREKYGVYMLSNTNPIMWNMFISSEFRKDGLSVEDYFDGIVTSFEAKALKPAAKIFEYAAEHCNIRPEETVFIDDSEDNLRGAEACGYRTAHVAPGKEFYDILKEMALV